MIAVNSEPFSVVHHNGFIRLLKVLEPRYLLNSRCHHTSFQQHCGSGTPGNKKKSSLLWKFCDELVDENSETESSPESTQSVVDAYLKEPNQPRKSDPNWSIVRLLNLI